MSARDASSQWTVVKPRRRCPLPTDNMYLETRIAITNDSLEDEPDYTYFHKFPELPKELRDMIWKEALPGPRCIEVRSRHFSRKRIAENPDLVTRLSETIGAPFFGVRSYKYTAMEKAPAMFFVNQEARWYITRRYRPYQGYSLHKNGNIVSTPAVYADFNVDILSFTRHTHINIPSFIEEFCVWGTLKHVAFNYGITRTLDLVFPDPFSLHIYSLAPGLQSIGIDFDIRAPRKQKQQVVGFVESRSPDGRDVVNTPGSIVEQARKSYMKDIQDKFVIEKDSKLGKNRTIGLSLGPTNERVRVYDGAFVYAEDVIPGQEAEWGFSWNNSVYLPDGTLKNPRH